MKYLASSFKFLPKNLQHLKLDIRFCNLGANTVNMKYLGDGIK